MKESYATSAGASTGNGRAKKDGPDPVAHKPFALTLARLIHGYRVSRKSRSALKAEWNDLAEFVEQSQGLTTVEMRAEGVATFVRGWMKRKDKPHAKAINDAIGQALLDVVQDGIGDEPDDGLDGTRERQSFLSGILGATTFNRTEFRLQWLIKRILVAGQPAVVGAPKKSMKTSTMVDMAVSLAAGLPFLGSFDVHEPVPVLLLSGESGGFTLQETIRRVCKAKGIDVEALEGYLFIGDALPQLGNDVDLNELAGFIKEKGVKAVIIDPLYLCLLQGVPGKRLDPSNLFDVGPLLLSVSRACLSAGAAPILVHHFKKNGAEPEAMPELEELAYAGIQEFARQWILLKRRKRFEPGSGVHHLWLTVGGSAGHSGDWGIDIDEGVMDDDFRGRRWDVTVKTASEIWDAELQGKQANQAEKAAKKTRETDEVRAKRVRDDAVSASCRLAEVIAKVGRPLTKTEWKDALHGWNSERFGPALSFLIEHAMVEPVKITKLTAQGKNQPYDGFRPTTPNESRTEPDENRTDSQNPAQTRTEREPDGIGASSPVGGGTNSQSGSQPGSHPKPTIPAKGESRTEKSPAQTLPASGWSMEVTR